MKRKRLAISFVVIGLMIVLLFQQSDIRNRSILLLSPVLRFSYSKSNGIRSVSRVFRDLQTLPQQNDDLNNRVSDLLAENATLKEVEHENTLLRDELKISSGQPSRRIVAARVIARGPFSFVDSVTIDRGADDGLALGQAVTLHGSLVGKITTVLNKSASVQLITSSDSIIQAQLQGSRVNGVVHGGIQGLVLEFIPQDTHLSPGENVVTSGLGGDLRSGIIIGTVLSVNSKKNDVFQSANINPGANLSVVDIVFVEVK